MCWVGRGIERIVERKGVFSAVRFGELGKIRNAKLGTDRTSGALSWQFGSGYQQIAP